MKKPYSLIFAGIALVFYLFPASAWAQLVLGQYEDEAPFRSWNTLGIPTASSLGMGEARFALARDSSGTLANPALLTSLANPSITISGSYSTASFNKYSIVNTGVLYAGYNSTIGVYALDFVGLSASYKDWAFGISIGLLEQYDRPHHMPGYEYQGQIVYTIDFRQDGILRNYNVSVARKLFNRLALGVGVNIISGSMEKNIEENYSYQGVIITDYKKNDFKGFYVNGGIAVDITDKLTAAAIFRTPHSKKAESTSNLRYYIPTGNTDIQLEATATNAYKQPLVLGVGLDYRLSKVFRLASDVSFFNWSTYSVDYYDEELARPFTNVIKIGGGLEYLSSLDVFGQEVRMPLRVGMIYDPQPMKNPSSHYLYYTVGIGFYWRGLRLDTGACFGNERGSGQDLYARRLSVSLSYNL